jgi:hypothetical protein
MIGDAWNIIGLNKSGRISCVADLISKYRLDFIGIQETKKAIIDDRTMKNISKYMDCNFLPAMELLGVFWLVLNPMFLRFLADRILNYVSLLLLEI